MTGLNLTLGVIGIVFGLALDATLDTYREDPSLLGIPYDAVVTREENSDARTRHVLSRAPGVDVFYAELLLDVKTPQGDSFQVRAVEGDLERFPFRISSGRFFQPNTYEALAGQGLLDWLGKKVGDEVTTIVDDREERPVTWRIVGQYAEPVNAGQMMMVSLPALQRTTKSDEPHRYLLKLDPYANTTRLRRYVTPDTDADLTITLVGQAIPSAVAYLQLAILGLAGILIGIATVNVFNTSLVAMQERVRQIGVLKTVGMTPAQVVLMSNTTAGFLGLLAAGLGIPLGLVFTKAMLGMLSKIYGFGQVNVALGLAYIVLLVPAMAVISIAGSIIPGLRAARTSIVQVLWHE
jgi:putative ABC transport system permease protein